jgi:ligand-binding SRPBCC domain-containing protein
VHFLKESLIPAPVSRVFAFHEAPGALEQLIPPWETVRVVQRGESLAPGTIVIMKMKVGPLWVTWKARHTLYEKDVLFQDTQDSGPFAKWLHTHRFVEDASGGTRLIDDVEYELPLGKLGAFLGGAMVRAQLEKMFAYRHQVTREACATTANS